MVKSVPDPLSLVRTMINRPSPESEGNGREEQGKNNVEIRVAPDDPMCDSFTLRSLVRRVASYVMRRADKTPAARQHRQVMRYVTAFRASGEKRKHNGIQLCQNECTGSFHTIFRKHYARREVMPLISTRVNVCFRYATHTKNIH